MQKESFALDRFCKGPVPSEISVSLIADNWQMPLRALNAQLVTASGARFEPDECGRKILLSVTNHLKECLRRNISDEGRPDLTV